MLELGPLSESAMSYDEAILYCAFCRHDGHTDWRMPTYAEWDYLHILGWYVDIVEHYRSHNINAGWTHRQVIPVRGNNNEITVGN